MNPNILLLMITVYSYMQATGETNIQAALAAVKAHYLAAETYLENNPDLK